MKYLKCPRVKNGDDSISVLTVFCPQYMVSLTLKQKGFTLIEVIAVLALIGILTVVIVGRSRNDDAALYGAREIVKSHLRYAQIKAMNSDVSWGINFSANSYTLEDNSSNLASFPGEMPDSISYSSTINPVLFDQRGSPGGSTVTITLTKGSSTTNIIVTRNTGFIP